jgi:hypothetical protein
MNPLSVQFLATSFTVGGAVLGVPSIGVLLVWGINEIRKCVTPPPASTDIGPNPDAMLLLIKGIAETMGFFNRIAGAVGQFLLNGLAAASVIGLILGLAFWFTGRGLTAGATWARVSAFILLGGAMLFASLIALSTKDFARVLMVVIAMVCMLGVHALWTGYVPQPR